MMFLKQLLGWENALQYSFIECCSGRELDSVCAGVVATQAHLTWVTGTHPDPAL